MSIGFRKKPLAKLSEADNLEQALMVTKPFYWLAVDAAIVLAVVFLLWACLHVSYISVDCTGVYVPQGAVHNYKSDTAGVVSQLNCSEQDIVQKGQTLYVLNDGTPYISPVTGKISDLKVSIGQQISQGEEVVYIRSDAATGQTGQASNDYNEQSIEKKYIAYVPYDQLSFIKLDDVAQITPTTVLYDSSGSMTGRVTKIGDKVLTWEEMMSQLGNEYATQVISELGAVIPVEITLDKDEASSNGYAWTSELGKQEVVYEGSFASIKINYATARPIDIFLPSSLEQEYA